ncbi:DUF2950 domain-containing protein [Paraburkholderia sp.]|uniref:DUF2950 domain-containing protein n=1 Tax=Paraburkholderia sp. TaxID=1926495 RepID=UPI002F3EFF6C
MLRFMSTCRPYARASRFICAIRAARALLVLSALLAVTPPAGAQAIYRTPDAAANAFVNALAASDEDSMKHVLGRNYHQLIPAQDVVQDDIYDFLGAWAQGHKIVLEEGPHKGRPTARVEVGNSDWTLPIPLVQTSRGWHFDTAAATDELFTRRLVRNERAAMMSSLAYLDAQSDYHALTGHYAQRLVSTPGQRDGLYWPVRPGEAASPLGPLAAAMPESATFSRDGYHGYRYRILTTQGMHAKDGPRNYVINGEMTIGYALIAWPVRYGTTGVMSFIVNQDGQLYQRDLGPQTARIAGTLRSFDPAPSWAPVKP